MSGAVGRLRALILGVLVVLVLGVEAQEGPRCESTMKAKKRRNIAQKLISEGKGLASRGQTPQAFLSYQEV